MNQKLHYWAPRANSLDILPAEIVCSSNANAGGLNVTVVELWSDDDEQDIIPLF